MALHAGGTAEELRRAGADPNRLLIVEASDGYPRTFGHGDHRHALHVDEIDILSIAVGVQTEVTLTALPGQTLRGTVTEIGTATNQQGVVTFPVSVQLEVPEGLELLEGLSATASIVTSEIRNVLLVPSAAIQGNFIQPFVRVATGSEVEERSVELGAADDFWVVVIAGLVEGEQVAIEADGVAQALNEAHV